MAKHQNTNSSVHAALRAIYLQTRTHEIKTGGCEASQTFAPLPHRTAASPTASSGHPTAAPASQCSVTCNLSAVQSRETFIEQLQTLSTDSSNAERCLFTSPAVNHCTLASDPPSHDVSTGARAAFKFNRSCMVFV